MHVVPYAISYKWIVQLSICNCYNSGLAYCAANLKIMRIRLFTVIFDFEMARREIPAFRGAIIKKVGRESILFHNHFGNKFRYAYPLIQYKLVGKNPAIICINSGYDESLKLFENTEWNFNINNKAVHAGIKHLSFDYFKCGLISTVVKYKINNWFGLNKQNFKNYTLLTADSERNKFLEKILIGNILSFAKGINWMVDAQIMVSVNYIPNRRFFNFKNNKIAGFDLIFSTNVLLPDKIGLGKSVSRGFGIIRKVA